MNPCLYCEPCLSVSIKIIEYNTSNYFRQSQYKIVCLDPEFSTILSSLPNALYETQIVPYKTFD